MVAGTANAEKTRTRHSLDPEADALHQARPRRPGDTVVAQQERRERDELVALQAGAEQRKLYRITFSPIGRLIRLPISSPRPKQALRQFMNLAVCRTLRR